jgi:hypothetical protein
MRKILLSVLMALVMHATSASAQNISSGTPNEQAELELFRNDDRDTARCVASQMDVSSLKNLSYRKGQLMEKNKAVSQQNAFSASDGRYRFKKSSDSHQRTYLTNLADTASSMANLVSRLDIENPADFNSGWLKDAIKALAEILKSTGNFMGTWKLPKLDRQINVGTIH